MLQKSEREGGLAGGYEESSSEIDGFGRLTQPLPSERASVGGWEGTAGRFRTWMLTRET